MTNYKNDLHTGIVWSITVHVGLLGLLFSTGQTSTREAPPMQVYSVTLEGGEKLGGIAQAPDPNAKQKQSAPPKKVAPPKQGVATESKEKIQPKEKVETKEKKAEVKEKVESPKTEPPKTEPKKEEAKPKKEEPKKETKPAEGLKAPVTAPSPKPDVKKDSKTNDTEKSAKDKSAKDDKKDDKKKEAAENKEQPKGNQKAPANPEADIDNQLNKAMQRYLGESTAAGGEGFGAGRLGGQGMGGGAVRPPEFFTYRALLIQYIKAGWKWPERTSRLIAQVELEIEPTGNIRRFALAQSSGDGQFDESVLRAVEKANPLPPPPKEVYEFFKSVRVTFDPLEN